MLTDKYMRKMVIYPYTAIPKMIKKKKTELIKHGFVFAKIEG